MNDIPELDWKYMKNLKKTLLDRLCDRILDNLQEESSPQKREPGAYEAYLKVYKLIPKWDKIVADCFDDWSRGNLFFNILSLIKHRVMTDEEVNQLSDVTKKRIKFHLEN